MFEHLQEYNHILVTGPQRSGTRIAAQMIAYDTGHGYIDERDINIDSLYRAMEALVIDNVVIQAPALCRWMHLLGNVPNTLIVMMVRDVADIIASQERINWIWESLEKIRYAEIMPDIETAPIAEVKYRVWENQKANIPHWLELEYNTLEPHPLWVDKPKRLDFESHQTTLGG